MAGWENKIILKRCEGGGFLRKSQMCLTPIEAARAENFALAALIGVYSIRAFPYSLKVWKVFLPDWLSNNIFIHPTSQGRDFTHPLKEYFIPPASQGRNTFHTFSSNIFILPTSQGRAFTHHIKEYFYNLNWNVKRTNDQAFRLSSRNDLAQRDSDSHIPGQLLSNGQMSLTN